MRELKFRIWQDNKGYLDIAHFDGGVLIATKGIFSMKVGENDSIELYTGIKDKNGKEIYEGDIVRYGRYLRGIIPPEHLTEAVSWWAGEEEYYPCCTTSGFALPYSEDGYEVIGNIHDNPELLEEK